MGKMLKQSISIIKQMIKTQMKNNFFFFFVKCSTKINEIPRSENKINVENIHESYRNAKLIGNICDLDNKCYNEN